MKLRSSTKANLGSSQCDFLRTETGQVKRSRIMTGPRTSSSKSKSRCPSTSCLSIKPSDAVYRNVSSPDLFDKEEGKIAVVVTHLNILLYATCFFMTSNLLPDMSKQAGLDGQGYGQLQFVFSVLQLIGGPIFGRYCDICGIRAASTISYVSAAINYFLLGVAKDRKKILFLSRIPALFIHAMLAGQVTVTDLTDPDGRASALGTIGSCYGMGMFIGPLLRAKLLSNFSPNTVCYVASFVSLLSAFLSGTYLPEYSKSSRCVAMNEKSDAALIDIPKVWNLITDKEASILLVVKLVSGLPMCLFQAMFPIMAVTDFSLQGTQHTYLMSYIGAIGFITQIVAVGIFASVYPEHQIIKWGIFLNVWAYLLLSFVQNVTQLCIVVVPLIIELTLVGLVILSALTKTVGETDTGSMLGLSMSVNNFMQTVSPFLGAYMLSNWGFPAFGFVGCLSSITMAAFLFSKRKKC